MRLAAVAAVVALLAGAAPATDPPTLRIGIAHDGTYTIRTMSVDDYVAGVLAGEAARNSSPAALEALAITVRTFALANRGRHRADGFDLCDTTHCQVLRRATAATVRAAAATAGEVLLYRGALASVFYTASCGGRTERPSDVWPGADDPPYLPSQDDDACQGAPAWTADLQAGDLARALRAGGFKGGRLRGLKVSGRDRSGRVARLRIEGFTPDEISGQDLRVVVGRTLGWQFIKSTAFDLGRSGSEFRFSGHGSGHGVGLCVIGSARLGAEGRSAAQILAKYFPGLQIALLPSLAMAAAEPRIAAPCEPRIASPPRRPGPDVIVSLPAGDDGERDVIRNLALGARDSLAKELGVQVPALITLRFHPTVESYQAATGQPWYTAATTAGGEVHLVPLTVLRDRGVLERTIRHQLVHVLTAQALAGRPMWVQEGAAAYFAGEHPVAGDAPRARLSCPDDRELRQPISAGALSNAYARAAACFARQIQAGRKWNEIK